jgi:VWFA-related protein
MMRAAPIFTVFLCSIGMGGGAQQNDTGQSTLTVRSNLVLVPVLVKNKGGRVYLKLTGDDFFLTDNGMPQALSLVADTDSEPLAMAIVVETGGEGAKHLFDYQHLDGILDALVGGVESRVAVIGFDSDAHLLRPFEPGVARASEQLASLRKGDSGGAILDGVAFAVAQLRAQPARFRRAILLLSETIDHGSKTPLSEALRLISDTNTTVYSFGFSSTYAAVAHEASKYGAPHPNMSATTVGIELKNSEPGPAHGCFSRDGADAEYEGHYSKQVLDCISQLAPPLRLATMAFLVSRNALRRNTAEAVAQLTGGEFVHFHGEKDLKTGLIAVSNDVPNYYVLSFHPIPLEPGLHTLHLGIKDHPHLAITYRSEYWMDSDAGH